MATAVSTKPGSKFTPLTRSTLEIESAPRPVPLGKRVKKHLKKALTDQWKVALVGLLVLAGGIVYLVVGHAASTSHIITLAVVTFALFTYVGINPNFKNDQTRWKLLGLTLLLTYGYLIYSAAMGAHKMKKGDEPTDENREMAYFLMPGAHGYAKRRGEPEGPDNPSLFEWNWQQILIFLLAFILTGWMIYTYFVAHKKTGPVVTRTFLATFPKSTKSEFKGCDELPAPNKHNLGTGQFHDRVKNDSLMFFSDYSVLVRIIIFLTFWTHSVLLLFFLPVNKFQKRFLYNARAAAITVVDDPLKELLVAFVFIVLFPIPEARPTPGKRMGWLGLKVGLFYIFQSIFLGKPHYKIEPYTNEKALPISKSEFSMYTVLGLLVTTLLVYQLVKDKGNWVSFTKGSWKEWTGWKVIAYIVGTLLIIGVFYYGQYKVSGSETLSPSEQEKARKQAAQVNTAV